jgi:hypothetical protein
VCELGGGMTCLAGFAVSCLYCVKNELPSVANMPSGVMLTVSLAYRGLHPDEFKTIMLKISSTCCFVGLAFD